MNLWIPSLKLVLCLSAISLTKFAGSTETPPESTTTSDVKPTNTKLDFIKFTVLTLDGDNSTKENDSTKYSVQTYDDKIYHFKFKDGAKCVELKYQDQQVYKHDKDKHKDQFPKSIFLHLDSKRLYLALKDSMFVYTFQDNMWEETKVNLLQLDIKDTGSTSEFDCVTGDNIGTYTPKNNILFKEVIWKKGSLSCGSDYTFIQATDPGQYAYKVVRDGTDLIKSVGNVNLYLINGEIKKFQKTGSTCRKSWSEGGQLITHTTSQNESTGNKGIDIPEFEDQKLKDLEPKDHPKEIKLRSKEQLASDSSEPTNQPGPDGSKSQESSPENVVPTDSEPPKYAVKKGLDDVFHYELDGFDCAEVKYNDELVWTKGQLSNECPKMLHFVKLANIIILKFTDECYYLYRRIKSGDKYEWECYKLAKFDENSKSKFKISSADNLKPEGNYGLKYYGFGFEFCFKKEFKCYNISYDELGNNYSFVPFWTYSYDVHKESYPKVAYCFTGQNVLILFEKNHQLKIDKTFKVDSKTTSSSGSGASDGSSGNPATTDGSGTNPSGGSTPTAGGGTTNESGGATTTNPASAK